MSVAHPEQRLLGVYSDSCRWRYCEHQDDREYHQRRVFEACRHRSFVMMSLLKVIVILLMSLKNDDGKMMGASIDRPTDLEVGHCRAWWPVAFFCLLFFFFGCCTSLETCSRRKCRWIAVAAVLLAHAATNRRAGGKAKESSQAYKRWTESQVRWRGRHGFSAAIEDGKLRIGMWWD